MAKIVIKTPLSGQGAMVQGFLSEYTGERVTLFDAGGIANVLRNQAKVTLNKIEKNLPLDAQDMIRINVALELLSASNKDEKDLNKLYRKNRNAEFARLRAEQKAKDEVTDSGLSAPNVAMSKEELDQAFQNIVVNGGQKPKTDAENVVEALSESKVSDVAPTHEESPVSRRGAFAGVDEKPSYPVQNRTSGMLHRILREVNQKPVAASGQQQLPGQDEKVLKETFSDKNARISVLNPEQKARSNGAALKSTSSFVTPKRAIAAGLAAMVVGAGILLTNLGVFNKETKTVDLVQNDPAAQQETVILADSSAMAGYQFTQDANAAEVVVPSNFGAGDFGLQESLANVEMPTAPVSVTGQRGQYQFPSQTLADMKIPADIQNMINGGLPRFDDKVTAMMIDAYSSDAPTVARATMLGLNDIDETVDVDVAQNPDFGAGDFGLQESLATAALAQAEAYAKTETESVEKTDQGIQSKFVTTVSTPGFDVQSLGFNMKAPAEGYMQMLPSQDNAPGPVKEMVEAASQLVDHEKPEASDEMKLAALPKSKPVTVEMANVPSGNVTLLGFEADRVKGAEQTSPTVNIDVAKISDGNVVLSDFDLSAVKGDTAGQTVVDIDLDKVSDGNVVLSDFDLSAVKGAPKVELSGAEIVDKAAEMTVLPKTNPLKAQFVDALPKVKPVIEKVVAELKTLPKAKPVEVAKKATEKAGQKLSAVGQKLTALFNAKGKELPKDIERKLNKPGKYGDYEALSALPQYIEMVGAQAAYETAHAGYKSIADQDLGKVSVLANQAFNATEWLPKQYGVTISGGDYKLNNVEVAFDGKTLPRPAPKLKV